MLEGDRLDELARRVYRMRLENPRTTVEQLACALQAPVDEVTERQSVLASLRLLHLSDDGAWAVRNPDVAADQLLATEEAAVQRAHRRIADTRAEITTLTAEYLEARRLTSLSGQIEVVPGLDNVRVAIDDLSDLALKSIDTMAPGGGQREEALQAALPLDLAAIGRGVAVRTLFQHSARTHWATREYATTLMEHGAELRSAASLPTRMILYDGETVLLPLLQADTGRGAVIVREGAIVAIFSRLFETSWHDARDFSVPDEPTAEEPSSLELSVLRLLAAGKKDEVIARQIGLSLRSTRRLVAGLMTRFDAESRFQAGARAVARGWIPGH